MEHGLSSELRVITTYERVDGVLITKQQRFRRRVKTTFNLQ